VAEVVVERGRGGAPPPPRLLSYHTELLLALVTITKTKSSRWP